MEASIDYISVGVNRVVNALAWGEHGGVAYAAHHMIALYDVASAKVVSTLAGHTGMVNCVLWLSSEDTPELPPHQHVLVSGAADNSIRVWLVCYPDPATAGSAAPSWTCLAVMEGHSGPVTSLAALRMPQQQQQQQQQQQPQPQPQPQQTAEAGSAGAGAGEEAAGRVPRLLLVSTAGDADVIVWGCSCGSSSSTGSGSGSSSNKSSANGAAAAAEPAAAAQPQWAAAAAGCYGPGCWFEDQRIHVGGGGANKMVMATTAALTPLPLDPDWTLLALGGTDRKVTLHIRPPASAGELQQQQRQRQQRPRFAPACVLEGHENWVRGVAFCVIDGGSSSSGSSSDAAGAGAGGEPHLLLASVSQDRYGRIWKLQPEPLQQAATAGAAAAAAATAPGAGGVEDPLAVLIQRYAPKPHVDTDTHRYVATSEALLIGHEDWVHGLQWAPAPWAPAATAGGGSGGRRSRVRSHSRATAALLTASMDRTMIIWRYEPSSGLWMNEVALGDAGASCLGYFGGVWSPAVTGAAAAVAAVAGAGGQQLQQQHPAGGAILAHGFTGALHLWRQEDDPSSPATATATATTSGLSSAAAASAAHWRPQHALGGHFGGVVDLAWGLDGGCLLSVSEDQTARVHTATTTTVWRQQQNGQGEEKQEEKQEEKEEGASGRLHWCEVARSQIHGHDFRCIAHVPTAPGPVPGPSAGGAAGPEAAAAAAGGGGGGYLTYVSGAEEKVLRVFEAPQAFIDTLVALRGGDASTSSTSSTSGGPEADGALAALRRRRGHGFGAAVAALGLSQKAVYEEEQEGAAGAAAGGPEGGAGGGGGGDYADGPDFVPCAAPHVVREPPLEEHLAQNTLWPETHKLYGHGNELWAAAASPCGRYLASACKAQTASTAAVWVWCTRTWRALAQLKAHSLTVTQLAWSPSGARLAAASRDRTFSIWQRRSGSGAGDPQQREGGVVAGGSKEVGEEEEEEVGFELLCRAKGAHGRVIWSVCWSHDERLLATAARDDTVKVWRLAEAPEAAGGGAAVSAVLAVTLPQFPCAATAVAFAPTAAASSAAGSGSAMSYHLAVGLEDGSLQLWRLDPAAAPAEGLTAACLWTAPAAWRHVAPVRRLAWRGAPGTGALGQEGAAAAAEAVVVAGGGGSGVAQLASCSEDHSVRVFSFRFA
ncbi:hypothetical protein HYH02_005495 [Chlamydomonas schloesseri]|uniref:Elongator complex protein 2 n=1 Tax=Chlamydomonas schloesseri TaxID=2026947 RepID=A0A835WMB3_9CHLO|nr:hypothetical protein HYH02_005495 [Chlamydomonas schloesseri]|eukprot:KAG2449340.1 hypothetical protein HYH02_005495 [Chlamydomonas schloesseri]